MPAKISQFTVVDPKAEIGPEVEIGPFCVVGPDAKIGRGTILENNVTISGRVTIGENNRISPGVVIGGHPQDISYRGSDTEVIIGDNNVLRECVTVNRASEKEDGITSIGSNCYMMACVHVAHDCRVGSNVIIGHGSMLGGHVHMDDHATISGGAAVHHFCRVGAYAFVGGMSRVLHDAPPFMLVDGNPSRPRCVNVVALKRNNFSADVIRALNETHRLMYRSRIGLENAREILERGDKLLPEVKQVLDFIQYQQDGRHGRGRDRRRNAA